MASRKTIGLLGCEKRVLQCAFTVNTPPHLPSFCCIYRSLKSASLFWFCRLKKLWGLVEGISSMVKRCQKHLQTMVPGLPRRAVARR